MMPDCFVVITMMPEYFIVITMMPECFIVITMMHYFTARSVGERSSVQSYAHSEVTLLNIAVIFTFRQQLHFHIDIILFSRACFMVPFYASKRLSLLTAGESHGALSQLTADSFNMWEGTGICNLHLSALLCCFWFVADYGTSLPFAFFFGRVGRFWVALLPPCAVSSGTRRLPLKKIT